MSLPGKRSKYRNIKTVVDGITFDSKKEANRYCELKILYKSGKIGIPVLKTLHRLELNGVHICDYEDDFSYWDYELAKDVVEDVKGIKTAAYRLKKKLMRAILGIEIKEV